MGMEGGKVGIEGGKVGMEGGKVGMEGGNGRRSAREDGYGRREGARLWTCWGVGSRTAGGLAYRDERGSRFIKFK